MTSFNNCTEIAVETTDYIIIYEYITKNSVHFSHNERFLVKKTKQLTFSGNKLHRFFVTMFPVAEKTLSEGTDVEGAHKYLLATAATFGNLSSFRIHHCNGLLFGCSGGSSM